MDVNFGIILQWELVKQKFNPIPRVTREFGGMTYEIGEPRIRFSDFDLPEIAVFEMTPGLLDLLPSRFHGVDWKFLWIDNASLDRYAAVLRKSTADEDLDVRPIEGTNCEKMLLELLTPLDDWAALFAWESEDIDDTFQVASVESFIEVFRRNLIAKEGPRGFLAFLDTNRSC